MRPAGRYVRSESVRCPREGRRPGPSPQVASGRAAPARGAARSWRARAFPAPVRPLARGSERAAAPQARAAPGASARAARSGVRGAGGGGGGRAAGAVPRRAPTPAGALPAAVAARPALGGDSESRPPDPLGQSERASERDFYLFSLFPLLPTMLQTPLPAEEKRRLNPAPFS